MTIECPKCQHENPEGSTFCGKCAAPLPQKEEAVHTKTLETPTEELKRGTVFAGRYEIIEELGKGGMGKVYRVEDTKAREEIALKLIKPEIAADKKIIERFRKELTTARKIVQKNVCRMYDLGEEKGLHYITMEYISGQDLKGLIRQTGHLTVGKAISIAKQICDGLSEAHDLGVVHRDLKPNNIMINRDGNAKIMDFGIARAEKEKSITGAGVILGTPQYMSPEQVEGKDVDQRSDIYSLGIILYEMLTDRVPFDGDTPLTVGVKQKTEKPKNPRDFNELIPDGLSRLILKCLEKDKENRYQNASELKSDLDKLEQGLPTADRVIPKKNTLTSREFTVQFNMKKLLIPVLSVIAIAVIGLVVWSPWAKKEAIPAFKEKPSLAVLPFEDLSPQKDQEYFCKGMTDEIISKLSTLKGWKVIPSTSIRQYRDSLKDIQQIGQELAVENILEGRVIKEEDNLRITATLIKVADNSNLWSNAYDRKLESVLEIQSDIAENIAVALEMKLDRDELEQLQRNPTFNHKAYDLYLLGRFFAGRRTEEGLLKAIEFYKQAVNEDPQFAMAYSGRADCYILLQSYSSFDVREAYLNAETAVKKALEIDNMLAEAHVSLAMIYANGYWDWTKAAIEFKKAIELNSNYSTAHHWYAFYNVYIGRYDKAISEMLIALDLEPHSLILNCDLGDMYYFARKYDLAIEAIKKTLEMDPNFITAHGFLGRVYLQKSMYAEALKEFQIESKSKGGWNTDVDAYSGIAYARLGNISKAREILESIIIKGKQNEIPSSHVALLLFELGEKNQGFLWLDKGYNELDQYMPYLKAEPLFDNIRSDPRYLELLNKIGLDK